MVPLVVTNTGTAPARRSASRLAGRTAGRSPSSPRHRRPPARREEGCRPCVTPAAKAIAGDYVTILRAPGARRERVGQLPHHGDDLDAVGRHRRRGHRRGVARPGRRGRQGSAGDERARHRAEQPHQALRRARSPSTSIDLSVGRGEMFGLLGPNGAGKTTTILMLLGLTEHVGAPRGSLGFDPLRQPLEVKRRVGYMPDQVGFYDNLTAVENLRYTARLFGIPTRGDATSASPRRSQRVRLDGRRRQARRDLFARHAPAAGARRDPDEGGARSPSSTSRPAASTRRRRASCSS